MQTLYRYIPSAKLIELIFLNEQTSGRVIARIKCGEVELPGGQVDDIEKYLTRSLELGFTADKEQFIAATKQELAAQRARIEAELAAINEVEDQLGAIRING